MELLHEFNSVPIYRDGESVVVLFPSNCCDENGEELLIKYQIGVYKSYAFIEEDDKYTKEDFIRDGLNQLYRTVIKPQIKALSYRLHELQSIGLFINEHCRGDSIDWKSINSTETTNSGIKRAGNEGLLDELIESSEEKVYPSLESYEDAGFKFKSKQQKSDLSEGKSKEYTSLAKELQKQSILGEDSFNPDLLLQHVEHQDYLVDAYLTGKSVDPNVRSNRQVENLIMDYTFDKVSPNEKLQMWLDYSNGIQVDLIETDSFCIAKGFLHDRLYVLWRRFIGKGFSHEDIRVKEIPKDIYAFYSFLERYGFSEKFIKELKEKNEAKLTKKKRNERKHTTKTNYKLDE